MTLMYEVPQCFQVPCRMCCMVYRLLLRMVWYSKHWHYMRFGWNAPPRQHWLPLDHIQHCNKHSYRQSSMLHLLLFQPKTNILSDFWGIPVLLFYFQGFLLEQIDDLLYLPFHKVRTSFSVCLHVIFHIHYKFYRTIEFVGANSAYGTRMNRMWKFTTVGTTQTSYL